MSKAGLFSIAAAALLIGLGAGVASAQSLPPERAPEALRNAPPAKIAPPMKAGESRPGDAASSTTGQGAAAGSAKLSGEKRSQISTAIRQQSVQPATFDVPLSIGTRVPQTERHHPLPAEVVTIHPAWRDHAFILVGDAIVIIDPSTRMIVAIIEA